MQPDPSATTPDPAAALAAGDAAEAAPTTTTPLWKPVAACAFTLVMWASAFVGIRHLGDEVPPGSLALGRLLVMALALAVIVVVRRGPRWPTRGEWWLIVIGGATWFGVYNITLNAAEQRIDAGTAALLIQVGPLLVGLLASTFLGERLTPWLVAGMVVGFVGVVLIARASSSGSGDLLGVLLTLVAAVTFAVGVITQKKLLPTMNAADLTFWYCLVGVVVCLPWTGEFVQTVGEVEADALGWIVYLGVFPSALAFVTWAYALSHADASKFALTTFLVPFITALMAWLLLDEVPAPLAFVGGALCIVGVLVSQRRSRPAGP